MQTQSPIKTNNTPNTTTETRKRKVSFFGGVQVRTTTHINDFTAVERSNCWYEKKDYALMKKQMMGTVHQLKIGSYKGDTNQQCARGLEYRVTIGAMLRRNNKIAGWEAVLGTQDLQFYDGKLNAQAIANAYMTVSRQCTISACITGLSDQVTSSESTIVQLAIVEEVQPCYVSEARKQKRKFTGRLLSKMLK
jgi:hypothetical protein